MSGDLETSLRAHVQKLAGEIGERNTDCPEAYARAAEYIRRVWSHAGFSVRESSEKIDGVDSRTLEIEIAGTGKPREVVLIGAHYDSVMGCPGANDNASGVAALVEIALALKSEKVDRTVRFVAFPNEEPPYFQSPRMGSRIYAAAARARGDDLRAIVVFDTIGCYSDAPGSQKVPPVLSWFYPDRGNFVAIVGNFASRRLVRSVTKLFREGTDFPVEHAATFASIPGVGWSDHASFWEEGYRAVMVTDTAPYRYPHYHLSTDTPEKVNYPALARVTAGMIHVTSRLAR